MMNGKQERFCQEYAISSNGYSAALAAGYSKGSARQQASRLLTKDDIKARIAELLQESAARSAINLDKVMAELALIAFSSIGDFTSWTESTVKLNPSEKLTEEQKKVVESIAETSGKDGNPQLRIKLHSKLRALEGLLKVFEIKDLEGRIEKLEEAISKGKGGSTT